MRRSFRCALLTLGVFGFIVGCRQSVQQEQDPDADLLEPLSYTLYTDKTELFLEFKPLVVGQTSRFAAHLTRLGESFKPLTEGRVMVSLQPLGNGEAQHHMVEGPSSPGIFRPQLTPHRTGLYRLIFQIAAPAVRDTFRIDTVQVFADKTAAKAAMPAEGSGGGQEISYLKEQAWQVEFATQPLRPQPFGDVIRSTGQVLPAPTDEAIVAATFDGIVQLANPSLVVGKTIRTGEPLVTLTSKSLPEGNLDARLAQTRTEFNRAKTEYERAQELNKSQLITGNDFETAKARYEIARSALSALSASYRSGGKTLTAPVSGFVREVLIRPGQFVVAGQPLISLTRNRKLVVRVDVSPQYAGQLSQVQMASLRTSTDNRLYTLTDLGGRVLSYGRSTDAATGFTPLLLEVNNIASLLPGTFVDVWLQIAPQSQALAIPESALIEEQGQFYVYVQTAGESFEKRAVRLGARDGLRAELISGVAPGERVVTKGAYQIRLATLSGTMPAHGHEH